MSESVEYFVRELLRMIQVFELGKNILRQCASLGETLEIKWLGVGRRRDGGKQRVAGGYVLLSSHDPRLAPGPRPGEPGAPDVG